MPTHRHRFTGSTEEDFPEPPIARCLQPGDIVEYEADEPILHARLETVDEVPADWERLEHHVEGLSTVLRAPTEPPRPRTRKAAAESASTPKED